MKDRDRLYGFVAICLGAWVAFVIFVEPCIREQETYADTTAMHRNALDSLETRLKLLTPIDPDCEIKGVYPWEYGDSVTVMATCPKRVGR